MLFGTFIHILTSLIRDFCTSDRNFASTFFQIPPHDGHPWSWLVVGHCDYNPHNRLSLSRYMPCPAYQKKNSTNRILSFFTHFSNNTVNYFLFIFVAYNGLASLVSLPKTNFNSSKATFTFSGISTCAI
jgi:hypothetical protein